MKIKLLKKIKLLHPILYPNTVTHQQSVLKVAPPIELLNQFLFDLKGLYELQPLLEPITALKPFVSYSVTTNIV